MSDSEAVAALESALAPLAAFVDQVKRGALPAEPTPELTSSIASACLALAEHTVALPLAAYTPYRAVAADCADADADADAGANSEAAVAAAATATVMTASRLARMWALPCAAAAAGAFAGAQASVATALTRPFPVSGAAQRSVVDVLLRLLCALYGDNVPDALSRTERSAPLTSTANTRRRHGRPVVTAAGPFARLARALMRTAANACAGPGLAPASARAQLFPLFFASIISTSSNSNCSNSNARNNSEGARSDCVDKEAWRARVWRCVATHADAETADAFWGLLHSSLLLTVNIGNNNNNKNAHAHAEDHIANNDDDGALFSWSVAALNANPTANSNTSDGNNGAVVSRVRALALSQSALWAPLLPLLLGPTLPQLAAAAPAIATRAARWVPRERRNSDTTARAPRSASDCEQRSSGCDREHENDARSLSAALALAEDSPAWGALWDAEIAADNEADSTDEADDYNDAADSDGEWDHDDDDAAEEAAQELLTAHDIFLAHPEHCDANDKDADDDAIDDNDVPEQDDVVAADDDGEPAFDADMPATAGRRPGWYQPPARSTTEPDAALPAPTPLSTAPLSTAAATLSANGIKRGLFALAAPHAAPLPPAPAPHTRSGAHAQETACSSTSGVAGALPNATAALVSASATATPTADPGEAPFTRGACARPLSVWRGALLESVALAADPLLVPRAAAAMLADAADVAVATEAAAKKAFARAPNAARAVATAVAAAAALEATDADAARAAAAAALTAAAAPVPGGLVRCLRRLRQLRLRSVAALTVASARLFAAIDTAAGDLAAAAGAASAAGARPGAPGSLWLPLTDGGAAARLRPEVRSLAAATGAAMDLVGRVAAATRAHALCDSRRPQQSAHTTHNSPGSGCTVALSSGFEAPAVAGWLDAPLRMSPLDLLAPPPATNAASAGSAAASATNATAAAAKTAPVARSVLATAAVTAAATGLTPALVSSAGLLHWAHPAVHALSGLAALLADDAEAEAEGLIATNDAQSPTDSISTSDSNRNSSDKNSESEMVVYADVRNGWGSVFRPSLLLADSTGRAPPPLPSPLPQPLPASASARAWASASARADAALAALAPSLHALDRALYPAPGPLPVRLALDQTASPTAAETGIASASATAGNTERVAESEGPAARVLRTHGPTLALVAAAARCAVPAPQPQSQLQTLPQS